MDGEYFAEEAPWTGIYERADADGKILSAVWRGHGSGEEATLRLDLACIHQALYQIEDIA